MLDWRDAAIAARARRVLTGDTTVLIYLALVKLAIHLLTNWRYGYHRDELYYVAGGRHLDWGYVDHPPMTPVLARFAGWVFDESLAGLRLFPALAGAGVVLLTGLMVRELGGGTFAERLAAVIMVVTPGLLHTNTLFQTVSFDLLLWVLGSYLLIRLLKTGDPRWWLGLGVVAGIGLQTKHTIALFGLGLVVGLLLTPARVHFRTRWPWLAGGIALLIFLPNLIWQMANGWPTLEFIRNNNAEARADTSLPEFLMFQALWLGPVGLLSASMGLYHLFSPVGKPYRALGWLYLAVLVTLLTLGGKPYYIAPVYPMLVAVGALVIERGIRHRAWRRVRPAIVAVVVVFGLMPLPIVLPVLPEATFARYGLDDVNEDFAEMFGWPELVAVVADVYDNLPPADRAATAILTASYGEAGAVDLYGSRHGLPPAISGHNSYYFWGPGDANPSPEVFIIVRYEPGAVARFFDDCEQVAVITNPHGVENEAYQRPISVCRHLKVPLDQIWPDLKHFN